MRHRIIERAFRHRSTQTVMRELSAFESTTNAEFGPKDCTNLTPLHPTPASLPSLLPLLDQQPAI